MHMISRRQWLHGLGAALAAGLGCPTASAATLPFGTRFKGEAKFNALLTQARQENWAAVPIGPRLIKIAQQLRGIPYVGYTLEIDNHIEAASCNFNGLDCWTLFEVALGFGRMLEKPASQHTPAGLLAEIEWTRYRGGKCTGHYLERIHYLDEWFFDNAARGNVRDLTRALPGATRLYGRKSTEMTNLWKSYRYLKHNPSYRPAMRRWEEKVEALPVYFVPKAKVAAIESRLADGDIIGIVTKYQGGVCSHVGLAARVGGVLRFLHASANYKKVVLDQRLSAYLHEFSSHSGIIAARPLPTSMTIRDQAQYMSRLRTLQRGGALG